MEKPTAEEVTALKLKYGDDLVLMTHTPPEGETIHFVMRKISGPEWLQFQQFLGDDVKRGPAMANLTRSCAVWPEASIVEGKMDRYPGLAQTFGNKLSKLAGAAGEAEAKKL